MQKNGEYWQKNLLEDLPGGGKKNMRKNGKKNQPEDLQVVKRRKIQEKMAKYPTGGLTRGEKKQIKSKNGKKTYWRTYKG